MAQKKDDDKGMHDGHRKRLVDLVDRVGIDCVTEIQAIEYVLFYIFPRGDVNPLAHRLLDRFGNFSTIMEASVEDLKVVKGMGETSAKKLHALLEIFFFYTQEKVADNGVLKSIGEFYDYIDQLLRFRTEEELLLFGVNSLGEVIKGRRFGKGNHNMVGINLADISLFLSTYKVGGVILVHNHPNGSAKPSTHDCQTFEQLKGKFKFSGCSLLDMLIVGIDGIYSMGSECFKRLFSKGLEYVQAVSLQNLLKTTQETQQ